MRMKSVFLVLLSAFCSTSTLSARAEGTSRLDRIRETATIQLGFPDASPPFAFLDGTGKPVGYSLEICEHVAQKIKAALKLPKLDVRYTPVQSATRIPLINNGTIDLECGTATNLAERHKLVAFAPTTFVAQIVLVARKDTDVDVNDIASFRGKAISAQAGGQTQRFLTKVSARDGLDIKVMAGKDTAETFLLMASGRAQGSINDDALAYTTVANAADRESYKIGTKGLEFAPYGILQPKDDPAFKAAVDGAVIELMKDGTVAGLYTKYFESPLPPRQVNLKLPMSAALKRALANPTDSGDPAAYE
ncbi:amino acid ABC transporter substrate-binding protein [Methylobacterium symbioticum]|uniref:Glutamate/aspartate import solute-binding protein n=1 Tax=Methylobacterium symbioticum TaxID=2584084 RepID=A0A509EBV2_9HYPH|nr:amino acid ABC transporter substrate-binding protein [Methylobacterium symbioticum]VUD71727.1 Glutamate/aspartate import solute-binding protein [Methylobacterium symbioticum]